MRVKRPFCGRSGALARDMAHRIATNHPLAHGFHRLTKAQGVGFHKRHNKWESHYWETRPGRRGVQKYIGSFNTIEQAASARDRHLLLTFGTEAEGKLNYSVLLYDLQQLRSIPEDQALERVKTDPLFGVSRLITKS